MIIQYLDPTRRKVEIFASIGGAVYGLGQFAEITFGFGEPLYWLGLSLTAQSWITLGIGLASLIHLYGIWLNGTYQWSPLIRAIGLGGHSLFLTWVTLLTLGDASSTGYGVPSGFWVYGIIAFGMWYLTGEALADLKRIRRYA